jgi:hypothetical protein
MKTFKDDLLEFYQVIGSEDYQKNHWFKNDWDGYNEWFIMYFSDLPQDYEITKEKLESFKDIFSDKDKDIILNFHIIACNFIKEIGWDIEVEDLMNNSDWLKVREEAKKVCEHFGAELIK